MKNYVYTPKATKADPRSVFQILMDVHSCPHMRIHVDVLNNKFDYEVLDSCPFKSLDNKLKKSKNSVLSIWRKCSSEFPDDINYLDVDGSYHIIILDTMFKDYHYLMPGYFTIKYVRIFNFKDWNNIIKSAKYWVYYDEFIKLMNIPIDGKITFNN